MTFKATRETPSSKRLKENSKRSRKQLKAKRSTEKPSWTEALRRKYIESDMERKGKVVDKRSWRQRQLDEKRQRELAQVRKRHKAVPKGEDDEESDVQEDDADVDAEDLPNVAEGAEVQEDVDEEKVKRLNAAQPLQTQMFLKGLPNDVTEEDVRKFMKRFGDVKKVFLVRHKFTDMPTGSAFVHFTDDKGASELLEHAQKNTIEVASSLRNDQADVTEGMSRHKAKELLYKLKHQQTVSKEPFVHFRDTRVTVHTPMGRAEAQEFVGSMHKGGKKAKKTVTGQDDPRNLYLLREGLIEAGTPAAKGLSTQHLQSLLGDYEGRKAQLRNVNYFVSKTRLSCRNLPRGYTTPELRKIVAEKAREFFKANPLELDKSTWGKFGPIKQAKIMVDAKGQSRRFGFVEMCSHECALYVLRTLNNNPEVFGPQQRPVIHFAVENVMALQKLAQRKDRKQTKADHAADAAPAESAAPGSTVAPQSYRQLATMERAKLQARAQERADKGDFGGPRRSDPKKKANKARKNGGAKAGKAPNRKKGGRR